MYYVYILRNQEDMSLYKGWTSDLRKRMQKHVQKSTRTTRVREGEYELIWYCAFLTKYQAIRFEKYLKSGSGRAFAKKRLINE
ncbi:MAG: GIY-YIG nuclease family protein [Patescibacteria group bacterium]